MDTHSKTRLLRLCFSEKKAKPSSKPKYLQLLPNFPIKKGRISVNSELPSKHSTEASARKEKLVKADVSEFIDRYKQHFEMIYPSIGQLVTLFLLKPDSRQKAKKLDVQDLFLSPNVATCSLVTINGDIATRFGITCLHAIRTQPPSPAKFSPDDYDKVCYFMKSEVDVGEGIWKTHDYLLPIWGRMDPSQLKNSEMAREFIEFFGKRFAGSSAFVKKVQLCEDLLQKRKEFIIKSSSKPTDISEKGSYDHPLLDPEFGLQPIPSLDLLTFDLPSSFEVEYATFLKSTELNEEFVYDENSTVFAAAVTKLSSSKDKKSFAYINIDLSDIRPLEKDNLVALVGYQNIKFETLKDEAQDLYRKSLKAKLENFSDAEFMNQNLSLGFCITATISECIFTFKGNTTEGSSGSPILDRDLKLLGINFGCYYDYQTDQSLKEEQKAKKKQKESKSQSIHSVSIKSKSIPKLETSKSARDRDFSVNSSKTSNAGLKSHIPKTVEKDPEHPKSLFEFDIEIQEPGAKDHEESLKNRNLAISVTHPVLVAWLKERHARLGMASSKLPAKFPPRKDKVGNKDDPYIFKNMAKR